MQKIAIGSIIGTAISLLGTAFYYVDKGRSSDELRPFTTAVIALTVILIVLIVLAAALRSATIGGVEEATLGIVILCGLAIVVTVVAWFITFMAAEAGWIGPRERVIEVPVKAPTIAREDFAVGKSLPLDIALAKDACLPIRPSTSPEERATYSMNKWLNWINDGARPKVPTESLVVLRSKVPCTKNYYTFTAAIRFDENTKYGLA